MTRFNLVSRFFLISSEKSDSEDSSSSSCSPQLMLKLSSFSKMMFELLSDGTSAWGVVMQVPVNFSNSWASVVLLGVSSKILVLLDLRCVVRNAGVLGSFLDLVIFAGVSFTTYSVAVAVAVADSGYFFLILSQDF
jgi:hypothetical protein